MNLLFQCLECRTDWMSEDAIREHIRDVHGCQAHLTGTRDKVHSLYIWNVPSYYPKIGNIKLLEMIKEPPSTEPRKNNNAVRMALLQAASEVAGHWNDRSTMVNQYEQAQRSSQLIQKMAFAIPVTEPKPDSQNPS